MSATEKNISHTPGPWNVSDIAGQNGPAIFATSPTGKNIRLFNAVEASEADLQIAAAAPDLLAACERAVKFFEMWGSGQLLETPAGRDARSAIAKGRGEV